MKAMIAEILIAVAVQDVERHLHRLIPPLVIISVYSHAAGIIAAKGIG